MNKQENHIDIELSEDMASGEYANLTIITHSQNEFILDQVQIMPGMPKGRVKSRTILTPQNAKRLMLALMDNVKKFETVHGELKLGDQGAFVPPMNFGGSNNQA
jgi:hypothetical protein